MKIMPNTPYEQEITREQMPSYIKPQDQPYHLYLSMQDVYKASQLGIMNNMQMQQQPLQGTGPGSADARNQKWD